MTHGARVASVLAAIIVANVLLPADSSFASQPSMNECFEASDFIRNAALSRDAGMQSEIFLGRMEDDFAAIRAFPTDLRWFAHDTDDEVFLLAEARLVFDRPIRPDAHRAEFLRDCIDRMGASVPFRKFRP